MKILLAGYNLDTEVINDLVQKSPKRNDVTPETLSASYARISRDPRPINELRKAARLEVEKARKSNKTIIFKMGHHSVAEHAVFNFDIIGISRLAIEAIERFRLNSYTEKSQRYITLGEDFVLPKELKDSKIKDRFVNIIKLQNDHYHKLYKKLKEHVFKKHLDLSKDPKKHNLLDGWAKEDARYITSLATEGQLGLTINARNLELLLRRFASHNLDEVRRLGKHLYDLVENVAPSIMLFYKKNDYDEKTHKDLKNAAFNILNNEEHTKCEKDVNLVSHTKDADIVTLATILHASSKIDFNTCLHTAKKLNVEKKKELVKTACRYMEFYDVAPRELEYVNLTYDMVVSASCFAQLKRHRMASIITQAYNPQLGVTVPQSIIDIGMENEFKSVIHQTEDTYSLISKEQHAVAPYVLTNAHRRRVLFGCNARELYHVSRLREDKHAQWDIQNISRKMSSLAKEVMPLTMLLIGGKDNYTKIYKDVFGKPPKITEIL